MLQLITYDYSLYLYTYQQGEHCIQAVNRHNGKLACSLIVKAKQQAISKKAGKKAGGLLSGGGGGATNKVAKVS
jgi:hypothetical protein